MKSSSLFIFLLFLSGNILAEENNNDYLDLTLAQLMRTKISIATKTDETLQNSSSTVTVFQQNQIREMGIETWTELLSQVPGFYSMMNAVEGNQSHVIIRGHAQKYANTLLVLLNGYRLNDDYTGGINYLIRYMDLNDVDRIEIIRGPGSAIYGSNAYSGVINIITSSQKQLKLSYGELNTIKLSAGFNKQFKSWSAGGNLSFQQDDGDTFSPVFDRSNLQNSTTDPRHVIQLRAYLSNNNTKFFSQYLSSIRRNYYLFRRLRDNVSKIKLTHFITGIKHQFIDNDKYNLSAMVSYQYATRGSLTALTPQGEPPFENADFLFGENFDYRSINSNIDSHYQINTHLLLSAGLAYSESQVPHGYLKSNFNLFSNFEPLPKITVFTKDNQRVIENKTRIISSAYLQTKWQINTKLSLTTGLRYDGYNDVNNALMPRLTSIYNIDKNQTIKLLYGQAYRVPSLGDLYDDESGLTAGNRNLKASEIKTFEFSYLKTLSKLQLIATAFANNQINLIGFKSNDTGGVSLGNVAKNHAKGTELEFIYQTNKNIRTTLAITHLWHNSTDLGLSTGLPMSERIAPKTYLNFSTQYNYQNWSFNLNGNWRSAVDVLPGGGLWLLNSNIVLKSNQQHSFGFKINNIMNVKYLTSSYIPLGKDQNNNNIQYYPARGRIAILSYQYKF
ncbi:MAG: TonB-dependent receptor [Alteromonadaceae bacterium]|nr:TonB-dependent receptor [Alteromonadaceae bacterium]